MDMLGKYLLSKVEHIISSLHNRILLWTEEKRHGANNKAGLKSLIHLDGIKLQPRILHSYNLGAKSKPPSPPPPPMPLWSSSSMMGDVIGSESGDCMVSVNEVEVKERATGKRGRDRRAKKRELPPPITLLRETGTMPWRFEKEYSKDGRLVIRAERVKRHEYVEAHRENGRLTMRLVEDDSEYCEECGYPIEEEELEDLEFNEEPEGLDCVDREEEEEEEEGCDSSEKWNVEKESEQCGDLRQYDSDSFWKGTGIGHDNAFLGGPGSAPLRPMTPVM